MKKLIPLGLLLVLVLYAGAMQAQRQRYYPFFQQEWFFGNLPSARTEAMGRADVAVGGTLSSMYYNPAGIGEIEQWEATFSTSAPYYALTESDYYFAGYARRINEKLVAAISLNQFAVGPTTFEVDIEGANFPVDKPTVNNLAITAAYEPIDQLQIGINANLFSWKLFDGVAASISPIIDVGALYTLPLSNGSHLRFGAAVVNASYSTITFSSPINTESTSPFPVVARAGVSYQKDTEINIPGAGAQPLTLLVTTEIQDLFNNEYRNAFRLGGELVFARVLALRLGYFTITEDDFGFSANLSRVNDFTYGFGAIIPVNEISQGKLPLTLHIDYMSLENPPVNSFVPRSQNKRAFSFRVVAPLSAK